MIQSHYVMPYSVSQAFVQPEDVISIRLFIVYGGYLATILTCVFALIIPTEMVEMHEKDSLLYISEGFQRKCGWSIVLLGTCSVFNIFVQLVAVCHIPNKAFLCFFILLEAVGWFIVLGIEGTGWDIHYGGLAVFLIGIIVYHWFVSHNNVFGGEYYRAVLYVTICAALIFTVLARISLSDTSKLELKSFAVSTEFMLCILVCILQIFLLYGLDQFDNIHVVFHKRY